ncbi:hypothetical protein [Labilibacter marinus]|uniref:hypothetical protein n=1 Tax=Labilibacter marinus TaxID=1477105 RepID=UPI0008364C50|nr:hypothetical protein [Labilibacter marinus]
MEQEIDTNNIKEHLTTITNHRLFNKSPRIVNLITFLVEQSLKGNNLKEDIIGMEVFDSDYTAVKNDGLVRVYMHKLRKKLSSYYAEEGKDAPIEFVLEKGTYKIKFEVKGRANEKVEERKVLDRKSRKPILAIAFAFLILVCAFAYYYTSKQHQYLWDAFFVKGASNVCIMADQVVMLKKAGNSGEFITDLKVNSTEDFIQHIENHQIDSLQKADFTFFTKAIPHSIYKLSQWFFQHQSSFVPLTESELRYEETKRNNIIYIGQFKTMSVSKELFLRNSKVFKVDGVHFVSHKEDKIKHYRPSFSETVRSEYAMVAYMPLTAGTKAIYIVSNNDIGTMALVNKFTDPQFLSSFYFNLPSEDAYFNALFKVEGMERTDISCELVELELIEQ